MDHEQLVPLWAWKGYYHLSGQAVEGENNGSWGEKKEKKKKGPLSIIFRSSKTNNAFISFI